MKKIEQKICKALAPSAVYKHDEEFKLSPYDRVVRDRIFKSSYYYLHDSCIFWYSQNRQQFGFSLRGYNTPTARSRLKALLGSFCNVLFFQKQGKVYLSDNGVKMGINDNTWYQFKLRR